MKPLAFVIVSISASGVLAALLPEANPAQVPLGNVPEMSIDSRSEDAAVVNDGEEIRAKIDTNAEDIYFDVLSAKDQGNLSSLPETPEPKLANIGYGWHWKKGINHWVAFPMLGLGACKTFVDLGRHGVGGTHGACQKSFKIFSSWYQLDRCDGITGMPESLLDGKGQTIRSCMPKEDKIRCIKEKTITVKGTCEYAPQGER